MDAGGGAEGLSSFVQACIVIGTAVAAVIGGVVTSAIKSGRNSPELVASRADFIETFTKETVANRDVIKENRELLAKIAGSTERMVSSNDEILKLLKDQDREALKNTRDDNRFMSMIRRAGLRPLIENEEN